MTMTMTTGMVTSTVMVTTTAMQATVILGTITHMLGRVTNAV